MKKRRPYVGIITILIVSGLLLFIWSESKNTSQESNGGLLDMIKATGDGIARRLGRG